MYTAPTTKTNILFICTTILLISTACLQTAMVAQNPTPEAPTKTAMQIQTSEPESGAVFEIPTAESQKPKATCAIVTAVQSLHLRELPSEKSKAISWLPAQTIVLVIGRVGDWWKVESAVGTGYANADYLQETECR